VSVDHFAVVTGASAGIGAALAAEALARGARVVDVSRSGPDDDRVTHWREDLADPDAWDRVAERFAEAVAAVPAGGRVTVVHNAGVLEPIGHAAEVDAAAYRHAVLLDAAAPLVLGRAVLATLAPRDDLARRTLCQVSSGAASSVYPGWSHYCAAKAAVDHWVRVVGAEQAERGGVEVCAVAPGVVDTGMQAVIRATPETDFPTVGRFRDLHREGDLAAPADVATRLWDLLDGGVAAGAVLDLRDH
jgi:benzil reductase ((S)-benzoin forming)